MYYRVLYFGVSEAPFLYYETYVLSYFGCLMKFFYDDRFYLFTCVKMYVCDELMVYETNANLTHS